MPPINQGREALPDLRKQEIPRKRPLESPPAGRGSAAEISVGTSGGQSGSYDDWTVPRTQ